MIVRGNACILSWIVFSLVAALVIARVPPKDVSSDSAGKLDRETNLLGVGLKRMRSIVDFDASRSLEDLVPFIFKVESTSSIKQKPKTQYPRHGPLSKSYARLPFTQEHMQIAPKPFRFIIIPTAGCALLITLFVSGRLVWQHLDEVISLTSFMALVAPRNTVLFLIMARSFEAIAMFAFFELLVCMMGDPEEAVAEMEKQEPFKIYGMPPLFCCYCCVPKMTMNRDRFIIARNLVLQYCVFGPLTYLLHAWNDGYVPWVGIREPKQWAARHLVGHGAKLISTLLCFWGLFQLYKATHFRLHGLETTRKFALIKLMLVLCELVHLTMYVAKKYYDFSDDPVYTDEVMTNAWIQMATCVLVLPLTLFLPSSFPVKDLEFLDQKHRLWAGPSSHLPEAK